MDWEEYKSYFEWKNYHDTRAATVHTSAMLPPSQSINTASSIIPTPSSSIMATPSPRSMVPSSTVMSPIMLPPIMPPMPLPLAPTFDTPIKVEADVSHKRRHKKRRKRDISSSSSSSSLDSDSSDSEEDRRRKKRKKYKKLAKKLKKDEKKRQKHQSEKKIQEVEEKPEVKIEVNELEVGSVGDIPATEVDEGKTPHTSCRSSKAKAKETPSPAESCDKGR